MELTFAQQSTAFLLSIVLGLFLGALYELILFVRICFGFGRLGTVVADILFMLCASVSFYLFSLSFLLGFVRIYVVLGCILGFVIFKLTVGKILEKIFFPAVRFVKRILRKFCDKIKKFAKKLLKNAYNILYNSSNKTSQIKRLSKKAHDDKRIMDSNEKEKRSFKKVSGSSKSEWLNNKGNKA